MSEALSENGVTQQLGYWFNENGGWDFRYAWLWCSLFADNNGNPVFEWELIKPNDNDEIYFVEYKLTHDAYKYEECPIIVINRPTNQPPKNYWYRFSN